MDPGQLFRPKSQLAKYITSCQMTRLVQLPWGLMAESKSSGQVWCCSQLLQTLRFNYSACLLG